MSADAAPATDRDTDVPPAPDAAEEVPGEVPGEVSGAAPDEPVVRTARTAVVDSAIGPLAVTVDGDVVTRVRFGADDAVATATDGDRATDVARQLAEYFAGDRESFDAIVDWQRLAGEHAHVLRTLVRIAPYGCSVSYGRLAAEAGVGDPVAARVVGQVLHHNPFPVLVPCHRVVMSDGSLGGFGGGVWRKEVLLRLEGVLPPTLFG